MAHTDIARNTWLHYCINRQTEDHVNDVTMWACDSLSMRQFIWIFHAGVQTWYVDETVSATLLLTISCTLYICMSVCECFVQLSMPDIVSLPQNALLSHFIDTYIRHHRSALTSLVPGHNGLWNIIVLITIVRPWCPELWLQICLWLDLSFCLRDWIWGRCKILKVLGIPKLCSSGSLYSI